MSQERVDAGRVRDRGGRRGRRLGPGGVLGALALLAVLVLAGCGDDSGDDAGSGDGSTTSPSGDDGGSSTTVPAIGFDTLDGRTFISTTVVGHELVTDTELRLSFEGERLAVQAGCNTMTGPYLVDDEDTLTWTDPPAATMMACDEDRMAQDAWITDLLLDGLSARLEGDDLTLSDSDVTIELAAEADASVVGTTWTLDGIIEGDTVSSVPTGVEAPTLVIAEDGTATVFAGCNRGGASVEVTDTTLVFAPLALTMMACEGDAATVEAAVVAVLDGSVDVAVDGESLTLSKGDRGLVYRAS